MSTAYENYYHYQKQYYKCRGLEDKLSKHEQKRQAMNVQRNLEYDQKVTDDDVVFLNAIDENRTNNHSTTDVTTRSSISTVTPLDLLQENMLEKPAV